MLVYQLLVLMGAWIIPLITSYLVHLSHGKSPIEQTRLYRGFFFRFIALDQLYHLEHHLYPMVPHARWSELAALLNPYFEVEGIQVSRYPGNENSHSLNWVLNRAAGDEAVQISQVHH